MKKYNLIVSGGTFDHFHKGHRDFLTFQFSQSKNVLIGVASDTFAKSTRPHEMVQPYIERESQLRKFLSEKKLLSRSEIVSIDSVYIPERFDDYPIEAIVVTERTRKGAEIINARRIHEGKKELVILQHKLTLAEDGKPISATRIREGQISRDGNIWIENEWLTKSRFLTKELRSILKKPFGPIIKNNEYPYEDLDLSRVITVGDIATRTFLLRSLHLKAAVIDLVVEREKKFTDSNEHGFTGHEEMLHVNNKAGQLTPELFKVCRMIFDDSLRGKNCVILVNGEEDLAVLPILLASPLDFIVFYGQPGEGLVKVIVTEELKAQAYALVKQFSVRSHD